MTNQKLISALKKGQSQSTALFVDVDNLKSLAETVCAFLNSEMGGTLFCGVDDKGTPTGIDVNAESVREIELALKKQVTPVALFSVGIDVIGGVEFVTIDAPAGKDRPYVVDGAIWVREKTKTRKADAGAIRAMLDEQTDVPERWERRLSPAMTEDELDSELVMQTANVATKRGRFDFSGDDNAMSVLRTLSCWRASGFTQAGDVLFSINPTSRHPQCRVQLLRFAGDKTDDNYEDYRWYEGPIVRILDEIHEALRAHNRVGATFRSGSLEREERPAYSDFALREGIVNALAHRDYEAYSGGVKVSIYPDHIEFWNTGRLPDELKPGDLVRRHPSLPVNPDIAHALYLRGFMDRTGRGAEQIAEECKKIGAPAPVWRDTPTGVTLTLKAALRADEALDLELNDRQRAFVEATRPDEVLTLSEYRDRFASDISDRQARRELSELEDYRFIRKEGVGRSTVYRRL